MLFLFFGSISAVAASEFVWRDLGDNTAEITKYEGGAPYVSVPRVIDGKQVVSIGDWAFEEKTSLRGVTLPPGLRSIGDGAFANCTKLESVNFPYSLEKIGARAFFSCSSLRELYFSDSLCEIGQEAFAFCFGIAGASLPSGIHPGKNAFPPEVKIKKMPDTSSSISSSEKDGASLKFDDLRISQITPTNPDSRRYVLIIANEDYRNSGMNNIDGAVHDGEMFKEYCEKVLGIPPNHIDFCRNATLGYMNKAFDRFIERGKRAKELEKKIDMIVYYAGHGIPVDRGDSSCLMPTDGDLSNPGDDFELRALYQRLGASGARHVCVFIDACFSGQNRAGQSDGRLARPAKPENKECIPSNMSVFTAAGYDQVAWNLPNKKHGIFTYVLLKTLKETRGDISYEDLGKELEWSVPETAIICNRGIQNPNVFFGDVFPKTQTLTEE